MWDYKPFNRKLQLEVSMATVALPSTLNILPSLNLLLLQITKYYSGPDFPMALCISGFIATVFD